MKKILILTITAIILTLGISSKLMAQAEDACPCGYDEDGECVPCDNE